MSEADRRDEDALGLALIRAAWQSPPATVLVPPSLLPGTLAYLAGIAAGLLTMLADERGDDPDAMLDTLVLRVMERAL